jgi:peptidoglycan/xylan/chitin deacetylase (PgdA/CDA1 family)
MRWRHKAVAAFDRIGGTRLVGGWFGRHRLTVLAYHRVVDRHSDSFVGFVGNVSATPDSFAEQMVWVNRRFNVVSISDIVASLDAGTLPERPLLVTFDDGYRDNHDHAYPVLRDHSIPAVVFLATDHIDSSAPFWWDRAAWLFDRAEVRPSQLPLLGAVEWGDIPALVIRWIEAAKRVPEVDKRVALEDLHQVLGVGEITYQFAETALTWDMVRTMHRGNVDFGAHSCSHPVLTRLTAGEQRDEVLGSVAAVEAEIGERPLGFAYPNGMEGDFDEHTVAAVIESGVPLAFTLRPGPSRLSEVRGNPLLIRRVFLHHNDDRARFAAKVAGVTRIMR